MRRQVSPPRHWKLVSFYCIVSLFFMHETDCQPRNPFSNSDVHERHVDLILLKEKASVRLPDTSPSRAPQPFIPLLAPSPLTPFTNSSIPRLSGHCALNFSAAETMISTTAVDCSAVFAPYLANVVCCPQLHATLVILAGQASKVTRSLALEMSQATHCLSDLREILLSQGAHGSVEHICSVGPSNLTEASCPVKDVNEFENIVDSKMLLAACREVNAVSECCSQICQNEILEAATRIAFKDENVSEAGGSGNHVEHSLRIDDCRKIVLRWLASKLDLLSSKQVLRRISNCNVNKACPLVFPSSLNVAKYCKNGIINKTVCCKAMENYISSLQIQSFLTNLQALHCAALLGTELQKVNVTENVYDTCDITLKDFSLQVGSQESGCLLPSLPLDATFDHITGVSFTCDLNDNIPAPWPSAYSEKSISSCKKTVNMPAFPAATSAVCGDSKFSVASLLLGLVLATVSAM